MFQNAGMVGKYGSTSPEAKFLGHDGNPCDRLTLGLLKRSHVVANRHRYIGKETSRHWEQGDDMSMLDFRCAEYSDGKMSADGETRRRITKIGIRELERETGIHHDTIILVSKGKAVKPNTLQKIIKFIDEREATPQSWIRQR